MAIDMELNDNVKRQLTDQRKECYEMFLFLMNQGFKRLPLWLNSRIMLVLAVTLSFICHFCIGRAKYFISHLFYKRKIGWLNMKL